jgi:D-glycero-D-manno-heptose 1,7-bisphosphate phosphatase
MGRKIAFLDRDGVLNYELGNYVCNSKDFQLLEHGFKNCKQLHEKGYDLVVITNQGGISKQLYTEATLNGMHQTMIDQYASHGIQFLEIYYCVHHSIIENCLCRKPKGLMMEKAMAKYNVQPKDCFLVGDHQRDMDAAAAAGIDQCFLIESNANWEDIVNLVP